MARVEVERSWVVCTSDPAALRNDLQLALMRHRMRDAGSTELTLNFRGGSQLFRILGGWISPRQWYPRAVSVSLEQSNAAVTVVVRAEERMGVGRLDNAMRQKYNQVLDELVDDLARVGCE